MLLQSPDTVPLTSILIFIVSSETITTSSGTEQVSSSAQYSPATMLAAGKFKRYIKRPKPPEDTGTSLSRRASQDRRTAAAASRRGSQDRAGGRLSGSSSRHGSQDKLSRPSPKAGRTESGGGSSSSSSHRLLRLGSLEMGRTNSDSQRRRKGFGILAQASDSAG